jgi:hypothetical protein
MDERGSIASSLRWTSLLVRTSRGDRRVILTEDLRMLD